MHKCRSIKCRHLCETIITYAERWKLCITTSCNTKFWLRQTLTTSFLALWHQILTSFPVTASLVLNIPIYMWSFVDTFALNIHWKTFEMNVTSKVVWQWQTKKFWAAEELCALFVVVDEKVDLFSIFTSVGNEL